MNQSIKSSSSSPQDILQGVVVRLMLPEERERWDQLMRDHHYLGLGKLIGESLRYVAVFENQWLALLGWASAALHCGARDKRIGWTAALREQRLPFIANNVRFLILPDIHITNLASRILGLNVRRLSQDWEARFNHPVFLAETFVDPERFLGTCYLAAGWEKIGETRGFSKSAKHYVHHGRPKTVWIKPLQYHAVNLLSQLTLPLTTRPLMHYSIPFSKQDLAELQETINQLPDIRKARGKRHRLTSMMMMAICAVTSGARSYAAIGEWAGRCTQNQLKRLGARYSHAKKQFIAPSEPTLRRAIQDSDAAAVDGDLGHWIAHLLGNTPSPLALDGKVLKGAIEPDGSQRQLLSVFDHEQRVVIAQSEVGLKKEIDDSPLLSPTDNPKKTNEIPVARELLAGMDIKGRIITADAMHTQRETARFIVEDKQADYVFTVKDNQKTLKEDIAALHLENTPVQAETIEKSHGRIETRRIQTSEKINDYVKFPFVKQVFRLERERVIVKTGKTSLEVIFGVTSRSAAHLSPEDLLAVNRGHWGIEALHYVRDRTFDEDRSQIRKKNGPRVMAGLRNFVISLFRLMKITNIAEAGRYFAAKSSLSLRLFGI